MAQQKIKQEDDSKAMPPPPPPQTALLEPEAESLKRCLQNAVLKTGQIYAFYGDSRRLGISRYASNPPQALTAALGREIEKYDQLCDAIESHLLRAIAVLQRDLHREERKEEAIRLEKEAKQKSEALQETHTDDLHLPKPAPPPSADFIPTNPRNSPTHPGGGSMNMRRPSAISISSLQRPAVPPKLDLSSSTMRMAGDEGHRSALTPPVSMAPKSALPQFSEEFMAVFAASHGADHVIDLPLPENNGHQMDPAVGSSGKPTGPVLDIEMEMGIFGDNRGPPHNSNGDVGNMFGIPDSTTQSSNRSPKEHDFMRLTTPDIFAPLSNSSGTTVPGPRGPPPGEAPSPATLLASGFPQHAVNTTESSSGLSSTDHPFDMNLPDFEGLNAFNPTTDFDMDAFFANNGSSPGKVTGQADQPSVL